MIAVAGISHKTAPLEIRERFAFAPEEAERVLAGLGGESLVLVTCNRTELYTTAPPGAAAAALAAAARAPGGPVFVLEGDEAAWHLCAVAAGLDSMVLGEPQILGQVKQALATARRAGTLGTVLDRLGQRALAAGRRVRRETGLGRGLPSIPRVATRVAIDVLGDLRDRTLLVVGAGKAGDLTARALRESRAGAVVVTSRTLDPAAALAARVGGRAEPFAALDRLLAAADIVISCTGAPEIVLDAPRVAEAMRAREGRPLLLIDLAVPRDVAAGVRDLPGVRAFNLDDLRGRASGTVPGPVLAQAEAIVDEETRAFAQWLAGRDAVPTIRALRAQAEAILEEALAGAGPSERERMREFGRRLLNKLLHRPLVRIRDGAAAHGPAYLDVARDLFAIDGDGRDG